MLAHEYSVIGHDRAKIGRYLSVTAGIIAACCSVALTTFVEILQKLGWGNWIPPFLLLPVSAAVAYSIAYFVFDRWGWRLSGLQRILDIPNLNGDWEVQGKTLAADGSTQHNWTATITIFQTWDKIKVGLKTAQSSSHSIAASLIRDPTRGYVLMYSYKNAPRIGEPELHQHIGYCELDFHKDLKSAEGQYFNNMGRTTFGRMALARKN